MGSVPGNTRSAPSDLRSPLWPAMSPFHATQVAQWAHRRQQTGCRAGGHKLALVGIPGGLAHQTWAHRRNGLGIVNGTFLFAFGDIHRLL